MDNAFVEDWFLIAMSSSVLIGVILCELRFAVYVRRPNWVDTWLHFEIFCWCVTTCLAIAFMLKFDATNPVVWAILTFNMIRFIRF
jgi:hypothetical protein